MKKRKGCLGRTAGIFLGLLLTFFLLGCNGTSDVVVRQDGAESTKPSGNEGKYKVYLVTMDLESSCWRDVDEGCRRAAAEVGGISYQWIAPDLHDDVQQSACIDRAVAEGANALLVAAASKTGVVDSLRRASEAGVKLVYVDSTADYEGIASVTTDNEEAGRAAAKAMQQVLETAGIQSGSIGIVVNKPGTKSTALRVQGFREQFQGKGFSLAETSYMQDDPENAKQAVRQQPQAVAFFAASERPTIAVGEQVKDSGSGQIVVGFDASDGVLALVLDDVVRATMQQDHRTMGYDGMKIVVQALESADKEKNPQADHHVPVNVITKDKV